MENKKAALITGGATGIGRSVALALAKQGINIAINYSRSEEDAMKTAKDIEDLGVSCYLRKADVSQEKEVREMVNKTREVFGRLDYLVNSAGTTVFVEQSDLEGLKEEHWDKVMNVNVKGVFFACRAATPFLKETQGNIVNITSTAGITGLGSSIAYAASKAAAISITKSLARVLGPEIRVNSVAPGVVLTRWVDGKDGFIDDAKGGVPLGRLCDPEDVAEAVVALLISTNMVTGQTLIIDGGKVIY